MKFTVFFVLLSILVMGLGVDWGRSENILPNKIYQYKLENGLKVVAVPFDSPGIAAFYIVVSTGSRNEVEKGVTGFAHFFEHMMFRGTELYPKEKYLEVLKSIGASANANTSSDRTIYHMTGNAEKLDLMFEIEADRFQNLKYSEHDFKTEAGAVKGEYTKNYASPYQQLFEGMLNTAFDVHTYKHTTMGFFEDIVDMPNQYKYSLTFFDRFYRPEYSTIVVVGDVKPDNIKNLAQKYFGEWKSGIYRTEIPEEPMQQETRYFHLQNNAIPPFMMLSYKGPGFNDRQIDMPALDVLSSILFSENSALYKKLVIDEQKVRFIGGGAFDSKDPNLFSIQASFINKEDMLYVKDEIVKALEEVKTQGIDEKLLADTKSHLKYNFAMRIDNPDQVANTLCHYIALTGDPTTINRVYIQYEKVSVDDIKNIAQKYFISTGLTISTISEDPEGGVQ
ncbi:MAG: insulinase family protein [bacterium]|nr:MAG: insulinase family protein [bacterium]